MPLGQDPPDPAPTPRPSLQRPDVQLVYRSFFPCLSTPYRGLNHINSGGKTSDNVTYQSFPRAAACVPIRHDLGRNQPYDGETTARELEDEHHERDVVQRIAQGREELPEL